MKVYPLIAALIVGSLTWTGCASSGAKASPTETTAPAAAPKTATIALPFTDDFAKADSDSLFQVGYATIPGNANLPLYIKGAGTITVANGAVTLTGARLTLGALSNAATTGGSSPGGCFDFSKPVTISLKITAASGTDTSKAFIVYVDNNTTSSGNSPLGAGSKVFSRTIADLVTDLGSAGTTTVNLPISVGSATSFIQLRTEGGASVTIDSVSISR